MRVSVVFCIVLLLSTAALAQGAILSGEQLRETLVGHTITGVEGGKSYTEYLKSDGNIAGQSPSGKYAGQWHISGNQICFLYHDDHNNWDCSRARLSGNRVVWSERGAGAVSTVVKGNPRGL